MAGERILVAMSGGVDSSVAALLLKRAGYSVIGVTAELFGAESVAGPCCGREGSVQAKAVCKTLDIPHYQLDLAAQFERSVIERFVAGYRGGRTPNPCSDCNRYIKFGVFFEIAREYDCGLIATGHHARIRPRQHPQPAGPPLLCTGLDPEKDQSYFLACINPEKLARIRFPVGDYTKAQVRQLAGAANLPTAARAESQDICFLGDRIGIAELMGWHTGLTPRPGVIVDDEGNILGEHPGIEFFTVGQRKGLKLGGGTEGLVVHRLEPQTNTVVVAPREAHPVAELRLDEHTDMAPGLWQAGERVHVRTRYQQALWPARISEHLGRLSVKPENKQYGVAPGQQCVGYLGDVVLFGATIEKSISA